MERTILSRATKQSGISFLAIAALTGCNNTDKEPEQAPNIVFILADDLGWTQSGAYGSNWYETPSIDSLAEQGIRFTQAYAAAAVCSPTRASIMTGKYPARLQLTDFIAGNDSDEYPLRQPEWQKFLPLEEESIAELFKRNGYLTASFGKWHLSRAKRPPESMAFNPDKQGFDEFFVTYKPGRDTDPELDPHNTDSITRRSVSFIRENKDQSFLLFVSYNAIHDPLMESEESIRYFKNKPGVNSPENHPVVAAMLKRMDNSVERILLELKKQNLEENTLVIFFSDNGGKSSYADQNPLREGKGWLYEGGIRVPLIVRWPGIVQPGRICSAPVISTDFYPTFEDILGEESVDMPDGKSFLSILETDEFVEPKRDFFWHYPHYHRGSGMEPASAIRSGDFKLIRWYERKDTSMVFRVELYNLEDDPSEVSDLENEMPELSDSLSAVLDGWLKEVNAGLPEVNL